MSKKNHEKRYTLNRIRSGNPTHADISDPRPRIRRAALCEFARSENAGERAEAMSVSARDASDVVHLSTGRAYMRGLAEANT